MRHSKKWLLFICVWVSHSSLAQNIDINILQRINPRYPDAFVWNKASSSIDCVVGVITGGTLAYGFIKKDKNIQYNAYELIISTGLNIGITTLIKNAVNRTRPADRYPADVFVNSPTHGKSFPSGHTSEAFAVATTLTLQYKKWYVAAPAFLWAGAVGYSRMYLGKHYPSDVIGGAVVGAGSSYLSHLISNRLLRHKKKI